MNTLIVILIVLFILVILYEIFNPKFEVLNFEDRKDYIIWYTRESGWRDYIRFSVKK